MTFQHGVRVAFSSLLVSCLFIGEAAPASNISFEVHLTLEASGNDEKCNRGMSSPGAVYLQYRRVLLSERKTSPWNKFGTIPLHNLSSHFLHNLSFLLNTTELTGQLWSHIQFRLIQLEHGGGYCNCWGVKDESWSIEQNTSLLTNLRECSYSGQCEQSTSSCGETINLCSGSASVPRGIVSGVVDVSDGSSFCAEGLMNVTEYRGSPLSDCSNTNNYIVLSFQMSMFSSESGCGKLSGADTGVEVAIALTENGLKQWVPILYLFSSFDRQWEIHIGSITHVPPKMDTFSIRGYDVPFQIFLHKHLAVVKICDAVYFETDSVQFRWLQTTRFSTSSSTSLKGVWRLDHFNVTLNNGSMRTILNERFDDSNLKNIEAVRNGAHVQSPVCNDDSSVYGILFNETEAAFHPEGNDFVIASRSIKTLPINLGGRLVGLTSTTEPAFTDPLPSPQASTITPVNGCPSGSVEETLDCLNGGQADNYSVYSLVEGLATVLSELVRTGSQVSSAVTEKFVDVASRIISQARDQVAMTTSAGSSILDILDQFAAQFYMDDLNLSTDNIKLITTRANSSVVIGFDTSMQYEINLPEEVLTASGGRNENGDAKIISFFFRNMTALFPAQNNLTLFSDLISAAVLCGNDICHTSNLSLSANVTVTIEHETPTQGDLVCSFWEFGPKNEDGVRSSGKWSNKGCSKNQQLSYGNKTVCECNHLTHFAILLSVRPPAFSEAVTQSLEFITYIGTAISLVAMLLTIFTFIALKSLRSMRNYIHINLCINLAIAQIIFVAGIDRIGPVEVPIHCQVIAVLLHYFLLVSFMWMLMEGVVLYVALVRVFVKHKKRYIFAFTISSYGFPLLYMGALTLPLGFVLPDSTFYGTENFCFLEGDHFVWSLIGPVILIFLANIGFLIMATSIMWHHHMKRRDKTKIQNMRSWLQSSFILMVIMGLTWIVGLFVVERSELVFLAYIYTVLVAFQGVLIFLVFVVFSKTVREAYIKWWRAKVAESSVLSKYFGEKSYGNFTAASSKPNGAERAQNSKLQLYPSTTIPTNTTGTLLTSTSLSPCPSPAPTISPTASATFDLPNVKDHSYKSSAHVVKETDLTSEKENWGGETERDNRKESNVVILLNGSVMNIDESVEVSSEGFQLDFL